MPNRKTQLKQERRKRRNSIFCQKTPASCLVSAAVFLKDLPNPMWVLCKGKIYKTGHFRYIHDGKEGMISPLHYQYYPNRNDEQLSEIIKTLNLENLQDRNPRLNDIQVWFADGGVDYVTDDQFLQPVAMPDENPTDQNNIVTPEAPTAAPTTVNNGPGIPAEIGHGNEDVRHIGQWTIRPIQPRPARLQRLRTVRIQHG